MIKVPLAAPQNAAVVSNPRLFSKCGSSACEGDFAVQEQHPDPRYGIRGTLNWLNTSGAQPTYPADDPRAPGGQSVSQSVVCHDITAYPEIGLAAGACQGDGILIDISDPVNPVRIDNVTDFNFAYWHSATFNNDGTKVIFTDEWGGGTGARCRVGDRPNWGANAIFDIVDRKMVFRSYYKLPVVQTSQENCVAHNGSLVPVPGRDVMSQAWYQGGVSVFDFTDSANPQELAFFDRGPISPTSLVTGGMWSGYWYNGFLYGTEIARGFDAFELTPTDGALRERDRGRCRAAVHAVQRAAPAPDHVGAELRARARLPRPGRPRRDGRRGDAGPDRQVRRPGREVLRRATRRAPPRRSCTPWRTSSRASSTRRFGRRCARCPTRRRRSSRSTCRRQPNLRQPSHTGPLPPQEEDETPADEPAPPAE